MGIENLSIEVKEVTIGFEDLKEYSKNTSVSGIIKVWRGIGVAYISLFGLLLLITMLLGNSSPSNTTGGIDLDYILSLSGFLFMAFLLFVFPWFIYPLIINKALKKSFETSKFIQKPQNYVLSDSGCQIISENGESIINWDDIIQVKETGKYLSLNISKYHVLIIPKRYLEGRIDVINFVKKKVGMKYSVIKNGLGIAKKSNNTSL